MDRISCGAEFKFSNEATGAFSGYASVFGGLDSYGDQVAPGAFTRTLAEKKAKDAALPMYMQHGRMLGADPRPVGVWTNVQEDGKGLAVEGRLVGLTTETGKYNFALMKEGAMRGLSIGFRAVKADYPNKAGQPRRILKDVHLGEISVVDDPADSAARITAIKSAATIREFEEFLRDAGGFSRAAARAIAAGGWKANTDPRDEDVDGETADLLGRFRALRTA